MSAPSSARAFAPSPAPPRVAIRGLARRRSDAHPSVDGAPRASLAVAASAEVLEGEPAALLRIAFRVPSRLAGSYADLHEAVAVLVDAPSLGLTRSDLLVEREPRTVPPGPNWLAVPDVVTGTLYGWITARVEVDPLDRPLTLYLRAALRDAVSPAVRVDLRPST